MKLGRLTVSSIALLATFGCAQDQNSSASGGPGPLGPGRVATVNGTPIQESLFRLYALNGLQKSADELTDEERERILNDLIRLRVLADEAQERGILNERTIAAELEVQRLQLIARAVATRFLEENPATEAELRAVYEENLPRLSSSQYKARHILLETEAEAASVIQELNQGGDFSALARERSTGPTGPNGGDLGWFSADSMVRPFADAVRAMEVGTHSSEPVQTRFGWHVILLEETRDQQPPGVEAVRDELTQAVDQQKLEAYVNSLMDAATVTFGQDN